MAAYRGVWITTVGVLGCAGLFLAVITIPVGALAGMVIFGLVMGSALTWAFLDEQATHLRRRIGWGGAVCAGGLVVVAGLTTALGMVGLLVALAAFVATPGLVRSLTRASSRGQPFRSPRQAPAHKPRPRPETQMKSATTAAVRTLFAIEPTSLDDATLCTAWRMSNLVLEHPAATDLHQLMQVRRQILDELELRHPAAFSTWLMTAPGATDDLTAYFTGHGDPPPTAGSSRGR
jgi:hypothetical protein